MKRTVIYCEHWTESLVQENKDWVVLFGDNLAGTGGQNNQAVIRHLPNAYGIPTKHRSGTEESAYFSDDTFEDNCAVIMLAFALLPINDLLSGQRTLVLPTHGLGTGSAQLATRAPRTKQFLDMVLHSYVTMLTKDWSQQFN